MFSKSISVAGSKGGVAKTTTSHMLALGLAHFGIAPVVVTTDSNEGRISLEGRPYQTVSAQTGETLNKIFATFNALDIDPDNPRVLIVDGGGNRVQFDSLLVQATDATLLPFRDSEEDIRVVSADLSRYQEALGLPSAWPVSMFTQAQSTALIERMNADFPGRILSPVPAIRSSQILLREKMGPIDTKLRSVSKALAAEVMQRMGINVFNLPY